MHRVELKEDEEKPKEEIKLPVPNAPCGVERQMFHPQSTCFQALFLMHRVELKVWFQRWKESFLILQFLMHRVELKA